MTDPTPATPAELARKWRDFVWRYEMTGNERHPAVQDAKATAGLIERLGHLEDPERVSVPLEPTDEMVDALTREMIAVKNGTNGPRVLEKYAASDIMATHRVGVREGLKAMLSREKSK